MRSLIVGLLTTAFVGISSLSPSVAADYPAPSVKAARVAKDKSPYCGCVCGCPVVTMVRHREVLMGWPNTFDPRREMEPRYFYGGMRTWPRYAKAVRAP